jgi:hypothetical protein
MPGPSPLAGGDSGPGAPFEERPDPCVQAVEHAGKFELIVAPEEAGRRIGAEDVSRLGIRVQDGQR